MEFNNIVKLLSRPFSREEWRADRAGVVRFNFRDGATSRPRLVCALVLVSFSWLAGPGSCLAQPGPSGASDEAMEEFDRIVGDWKSAYLDALEALHEFRTCEEAEQDELRQRFLDIKARGDDLRLNAIETAAEIYRNSDSGTPSLLLFLGPLPLRLFDESRFRLSGIVCEALYTHNPGREQLLSDGIRASFFGNDYDRSARLIEKWEPQFGPLPDNLVPFSQIVPVYREAWNAEQAHLAKARSESVLPRVRFETDMGSFIVELDEDRYPVIVNNLIYGIENNGLYRGIGVFYALEKQYIRSGCPTNNGMSFVPIAPVTPETVRQSARHFRGTFALLINPRNGTAVTQFNICRTPTPEFDGVDLPIGRVVEGMHVVDQLTNTVEMDDRGQENKITDAQPSGIIDVEVLKKRDHGYTSIREN